VDALQSLDTLDVNPILTFPIEEIGEDPLTHADYRVRNSDLGESIHPTTKAGESLLFHHLEALQDALRLVIRFQLGGVVLVRLILAVVSEPKVDQNHQTCTIIPIPLEADILPVLEGIRTLRHIIRTKDILQIIEEDGQDMVIQDLRRMDILMDHNLMVRNLIQTLTRLTTIILKALHKGLYILIALAFPTGDVEDQQLCHRHLVEAIFKISLGPLTKAVEAE
jgi:hypothetical protein